MVAEPPLRAIWSRRWMVLGVATLATLVAGVGSTLQRPTYAADATLRLATLTTTVGGLRPDLDYSDRVANTYASLAATTPVLDDVRERLQLAARPMIYAWVPAGSELIHVRAEARSAGDAARIANAGAAALTRRAAVVASRATSASAASLRARLKSASAELKLARREALRTRRHPAQHEVALDVLALREARYREFQSELDIAVAPIRRPSLSMLQRATAPTSAQFPGPVETSLLGALLGLLAGSAVAIHRGHAEPKVRSELDLDARNKPVLGTIPRVKGLTGHSLGRSDAREESFRRLRASLLVLGQRAHSVVVTSPDGAAGTTTVVANLGASLASDGRRVVIVDANLRWPRLHRMLSLDGAVVGFSDVLAGQISLRDAVRESGIPNLDVLTSGTLRWDALEALADERMGPLLAELGAHYDHVLIDAPGVLECADAVQLGPLAAGIVLVVRAGRTDLEAVRAASDGLELVGAHLLGVIVNDPAARRLTTPARFVRVVAPT